MAIFECVGGISPTGNALPGDVKEGVSFSNENDVDIVGTFAAQEKIITSSRDSQIVVPDDGKYLSKVTVNGLAPSGTFTPTSRASNIDMGAKANYRYVSTESVPNNNSGTYTFPSGNTGGTKDLGATNTYRYVNAGNVYTAGKKIPIPYKLELSINCWEVDGARANGTATFTLDGVTVATVTVTEFSAGGTPVNKSNNTSGSYTRS